MRTAHRLSVAPAMLLAIFSYQTPCSAEIILGDPPPAPIDVSGLPGGGPKPQSVTGGFSVDITSREQVRSFYRGIYPSSDGVAMDTTSDVSSCTPGTNSTAFQEAVLRRLNWFRAMAGIPAAVTFDNGNNTNDQQAAVMMSANNNLNHFPPPSWTCFSGPGAHAASNSNLALGSDGATAITGYMRDHGANNYEVGHRRWLLYPQTQVMGTGDVPAANGLPAANAVWVFDNNFNKTRPPTRHPYVSWPPDGYVPYPVVYPQWSCALTNANFTNATVSMTSNGVSIAVSVQPYLGAPTPLFGENTLVWVPMGLDPTVETTVFPFGGTDTVYGVTINNIKVGASTISLSYNVTVFDPTVPGVDYVPPTISGPSQPAANTGNPYSCQAVNNPNVTSYQWRTSQTIPGSLTDNADNGSGNFTLAPPPNYPVLTNDPFSSATCFNLQHADTNAAPQLFQFNELFLPASNGSLSFQSELGFATANEVARLQVSTDGGLTWEDLFTQPGNDSYETGLTFHTFSLSNYAGRATLLRFNFDYLGGSYDYTGYPLGWYFTGILVTNTGQLVNLVTNSTPSTNFTFTPTQTGGFNLEARAVIFSEFPLDWGPVKQVTVVPAIVMNQPVLNGNQLRLDFTSTPASTGTFKLLQVSQLGTPWTTNAGATFTTNVPGTSYRFTTTNGPGARYFRILELSP